VQVVEHSYSCALERSFLYHGRMYLSAWHMCFHSNVFAKQMKVNSCAWGGGRGGGGGGGGGGGVAHFFEAEEC
jgi:uncharacterized membrane protein